jgi:hypothetical protein
LPFAEKSSIFSLHEQAEAILEVEILNGSTTIFRKYVPGNLSDEEAATML